MDKIAYPASYLRAEGWADEIPGGGQNGSTAASTSLEEITRQNAEAYR